MLLRLDSRFEVRSPLTPFWQRPSGQEARKGWINSFQILTLLALVGEHLLCFTHWGENRKFRLCSARGGGLPLVAPRMKRRWVKERKGVIAHIFPTLLLFIGDAPIEGFQGAHYLRYTCSGNAHRSSESYCVDGIRWAGAKKQICSPRSWVARSNQNKTKEPQPCHSRRYCGIGMRHDLST